MIRKFTLLLSASMLILSANAEVNPNYKRPQGSFYMTYWSTENARGFNGYNSPYIHVDSFSDVTFENTQDGTYNWRYQAEDIENSILLNKSSEEQNLKYFFGSIDCKVPELSVTSAGSTNTYQLCGYDSSGDGSEAKGNAVPVKLTGMPCDPSTIDANTDKHFWSSSKFFGYKSNRDGVKSSGSYTWSLGKSVGMLFGKNSDAKNYSGLATAFEAPLNPYLIKAMAVKFERLILADDAPDAVFTMRIYSIDGIPAYDDEASVEITPGQLLASKSLTISRTYLDRNFNKSNDKYLGIMRFPLDEMLKVNGAILVTLTGYNVDAVADFTAYSSTDYYDEGYGELGYIYVGAEGKWRGINNIVSGLKGRKAAPTIFIEVERPLLYWMNPKETGEMETSCESATKLLTLLASRGTETGDLVCSAPDWIEVQLFDNIDEDYGYYNETEVQLNIAKNESAEPREGDVLLTLNNCRTLKYHVSQQGKFSGINGINGQDAATSVEYVNALGQVSSKPFGGLNIVVTKDAEGKTVISKIIK